MKKNKREITFYVLNIISLVFIFLSIDSSYLTDETRVLDKIITIIIILNLGLYSFWAKKTNYKGNVILYNISVLVFIYTIFSVSYEDEMESYLYRLLCVFNVNSTITNKPLSSIIQNIWFISFVLSLLLEIFFLIRLGYDKITRKV